jgi:hypothetical protein
MRFFNSNTSDQQLQAKASEAFAQAWDVEMHNLKNKSEKSVLLSHGYQGNPVTADFNKDFTVLGQYTTAIAGEVYNQVMTMVQSEDPIMSRVKGHFEDAQEVYFQTRDAQAGLATGGSFGSSVISKPTTGRGAMKASTGFFGSKVSLGMDELVMLRDTKKLDGTYAAEAMRRAVSQTVIEMYQRQRLVVARTITDNEYTYYQNAAKTQAVTLQYGRLSANNFSVATKWQTVNTTTGAVTDNLNANPINDLIDLFTNPQNTIIQNTLPYLKGLLMNPQTARVLTKFAQNSKSPIDAIAYMAAKGGNYEAENVIKSNVPALKNVDIMIYDGRVNTAVDANNGTISATEYIIPTGLVIPVIDYEQVGMGTMLFTPEPRSDWLYGTSALPTGSLGVSNPRSAYMRVVSSLQDPRAETPYWFVEAGARYSFINPIAASTSWILEVGDFVS